MMRMAFQSSPILSLPRSAVSPLRDVLDFAPRAEPSPESEGADGFSSIMLSTSCRACVLPGRYLLKAHAEQVLQGHAVHRCGRSIVAFLDREIGRASCRERV